MAGNPAAVGGPVTEGAMAGARLHCKASMPACRLHLHGFTPDNA